MDASVYAPVADMLLRIGWDIETAKQAELTDKINDTKWVIYARRQKRIAVTFDELKAKQGEQVSRELRRHGGSIIRINGARNEYRAIGKLLYHFYDWYPFLQANNGVSVISDTGAQGYKNYTPEEYHQHYHPIDAQIFTTYLTNKKKRPYHPRKRKPQLKPINQIILAEDH
ncbi:MAG: hypothetical protein PHY28_05095 [Dehalococcoidales bacterium]|nr:hypothetical protein [Dehalococcoidales bacterium]